MRLLRPVVLVALVFLILCKQVLHKLTAAVVVAVPHKVAVLLALAVPVVVVLADLLEQTTMETQQQPTLVVVAAAGQLPALELQMVVLVAAA